MAIPESRVFLTLDDDTTFGTVVDTVAGRLGGELWFRGESMEHPIPANPVFARTPGFNTDPIEPCFNNGNYSFPLRILTVGERDMIQDLQRNPPGDPYFPSLFKHHDHPGWFALARHHGRPTRLLYNVLIF